MANRDNAAHERIDGLAKLVLGLTLPLQVHAEQLKASQQAFDARVAMCDRLLEQVSLLQAICARQQAELDAHAARVLGEDPGAAYDQARAKFEAAGLCNAAAWGERPAWMKA